MVILHRTSSSSLVWYRLTLCRYKHRLNHPGVHIPHGVQYQTSFKLPDEYADHPLYPPIRPKYPPGRLKSSREFPFRLSL